MAPEHPRNGIYHISTSNILLYISLSLWTSITPISVQSIQTTDLFDSMTTDFDLDFSSTTECEYSFQTKHFDIPSLNGLWADSGSTYGGEIIYTLTESNHFNSSVTYTLWPDNSSSTTSWIVLSNNNDALHIVCAESDIADCSTSTWYQADNASYTTFTALSDALVYVDEDCWYSLETTTPAPTAEGCVPSIQTANFENDELDGIWTQVCYSPTD